MVKLSRARNWCFTINNPDDEDIAGLEWVTANIGEQVRYLIFGIEGEGKTDHIQGYVEFYEGKSMATVKAIFDVDGMHLEERKGTAAQAADYCKKEGSFLEFGCISKQGARKDLDVIRESIKSGASELEIAEGHFNKWVVYRNSFSVYRGLLLPRRDWVTKVYLLVGTTGTGKSRLAHSLPGRMYVAFDNSGKWFDGYNGEENVLFDDFTSQDAALGFFLQLCDRYPMRVPVKGNSVEWIPKKIVFTSNLILADWWRSATAEQRDAFRRRVTEVYNIENQVSFTDANRGIGYETFYE
jgi:hypothetical protein